MMEAIVEGFVEFIPQSIGWAVLKVLSRGIYRGFRQEDARVEGAVGLLVLAALTLAAW